MIKRNKIISIIFIIIIAIILNVDVIFTKDSQSIFSHIIHCIGEGIVILMFSRNLRD